MVAGVLTSIVAAVVVLLGYYTWIERFVARGEPWSAFAWLSGAALATLTFAAGVAWSLGW